MPGPRDKTERACTRACTHAHVHALARTHTQDVSSQSNECINKISLFIIAIIITMNKARSDAISGAAWLGKGGIRLALDFRDKKRSQ